VPELDQHRTPDLLVHSQRRDVDPWQVARERRRRDLDGRSHGRATVYDRRHPIPWTRRPYVQDFWSRLEEVRARWNVLEHPFYQRWSAGELSRDELARYAGEYRHAVVALADAAAGAARHAGPGERRA